ncbi:MAG: oxidoreductase [Omnitrophica WOR_2 bacterium GWF2_38_59]|nr:MAG: oxidoreductase [Omnitrophica WOR_2 bacterium GWF2_38_59]OGX48889.1 MAG: oxidoreductase [Omnitrophica WOR_2 bacterium RIFOXYA2_FULL_38_17]OGX52567.1 MAG: oxidoreductase [Omnitrophica WOR_2 bacterium RIFOXYA12_FULL_38_10]OGX56869.1 MAG: oxidoreductase [Omnitrophica WOR_2 bacterium RIFOXYB2_FULL_38_16]OGX57619.1 MAG: oxidoreductase [Omnitrophica WOR_2 bacterium RIFOXYC2_FULL_38_12]
MQKNIAVIGTGGWGKNLVRNFHEIGALKAISDSNKENLKKIKDKYGIKEAYTNYQDILSDKTIKAVVISSPAATHYEITKAALLSGKDAFVEKPLALNINEAEELINTADSNNRVLMVDHLLQYHPAVNKLKQLIDSGSLGKLQYIYSNRLNIGKLRSEENILWSFAPHDISVILGFVEKEPISVKVFGEAYLQDRIYDTTITDLSFSDRLKAHIFVSWLHPYKEQKLVVIGSKAMAVFNDLEPEEKLVLYPHKVEWIHQVPIAAIAEKEVVDIDKKEPLREACLHFLNCIETRQKPKTDGKEALRVLKVLQKAQEYLDKE